MPLVINWYGTQPNPVTDQLLTDWQSSESATRRIGMVITYTSTDFPGGMAELTWDTGAGFSGTPRLNALNFASGFSSAAYDFSFNWSIDPEREVLVRRRKSPASVEVMDERGAWRPARFSWKDGTVSIPGDWPCYGVKLFRFR
jgi:hypothetical protein